MHRKVAELFAFATSPRKHPRLEFARITGAIAKERSPLFRPPRERLIAVTRCREDPIIDARLRERILCPRVHAARRLIIAAAAYEELVVYWALTLHAFTLLASALATSLVMRCAARCAPRNCYVVLLWVLLVKVFCCLVQKHRRIMAVVLH